MKIICRIFLILFATILYGQENEIEIFNTSINSSYAEFGITYFNSDKVIFASSKKVESDKSFSKSRRETNQQLFLELYQGIVAENGDIIETGKFSSEDDNKFFESDISFTPDGKTIYFTWNNFYNTQTRKDSAKWKSLQLMKASVNERFEISNITHLPFNSETYSVRYPEISKDGKQLFFASDMPNGYGGLDIYVVDIQNNGDFSKPKNLGANINSKEDEIFPFVDENKTLYFSSYGHSGLGGFDIYESKFELGNYLKIQNLPIPINSKYDDFGYVINNANNTGYFTSNRKDSKGGVDIYAFKIKEKECIQNISGLVFNENDKKQVPLVSITLFINDYLVEKKLTLEDSKFSFNLKCNTSYKIKVEKEGFLPKEFELITDSNGDFEIKKDVVLTPLECSHTISGYVLNDTDKKQLTQAKVSLYVNNELKETTLTQLGLKFNFIINCGDTYKITAEKTGFAPSEIVLETNNRPYYLADANIILKPVECSQTVSGYVINEKNSEQLSQAKVSLLIYGILTDTQITQNDLKFNFKIPCNSAIKIIAEKDGFLTSEITFSTEEINDYSNEMNLTLVPIECVQTIAGNVFNQTDNKKLVQTKVSLFIDNELKETQLTSADASFKFKVACDTSYKIIAEKEGFTPSQIEIKTDDTLDFSIAKNIALIPVECIQTIAGFIFNKADNKQLEQTKVSLFIDNVLKETQLTSADANFKFKVACDTSYKIIAEKDGFTPSQVEIKTDNKLDFVNTKNIALAPIECIQTIAGYVYNESNKKQLAQTKVSLFIDNVLKETQLTNVDIKFNFKVACNSSYKIIAEKDGFIPSEIELRTGDILNFFNDLNIAIKPIECKGLISGTILDVKTKKPIINAVVQIFKDDKLLNNLTLDANALFNMEADCNSAYKIIVSSRSYENKTAHFISGNQNGDKIFKEILLEPLEEIVSVNNQKIIKTDVIYFNLDSDEISTDTAIELNKVIGVLIKYPTMKIEIGSHTDSRAPDDYNLNLSEKRAKSIIRYMELNGINSDRLVAVGYGETKLLNKCANGVSCSNTEHELNRRTEFIIIEE